MMRIFIWLRKAILSLILCLIGTIILSLALLATPQGTQWIWHQIHHWSPDTVTLGKISGTLLGAGKIDQFNWHSKDSHIQLHQISWQWQPEKLLTGIFKINQFQIARIEIDSNGPSDFQFYRHFIQKHQSFSLPLMLNLDNLSIDNIQLSKNHRRIYAIKSIQLQAIAHKHQVYLPKWTLHSDGLDIAAETRLTFIKPMRIAQSADLHIALPKMQPIQLTTQLNGTLEKLTLYTIGKAPYNSALSITVKDILQQQQLSGQLSTDFLSLGNMNTHWPNQSFQLKGNLSGVLLNPKLEGTTSIHSKKWGDFNAYFSSLWSGSSIQLKYFQLQKKASHFSATGLAYFNLLKKPIELSAQIQWQNMNGINDRWKSIQSSAGKAHITGTMNNYHFSLATTADLPSLHTVQLHAQGKGSLTAIQLAEIKTQLLDGEIQSQGEISWSPHWYFKGQATGTHIKPERYHGSWPGILNFTTQFHGSVSSPHALAFSLDHATLSGQLKTRLIEASGEHIYYQQKNKNLDLPHLNIRYADTNLTAQGNIGQYSKLKLLLDTQHLEYWLPQSAGALHLTTEIQGSIKNPLVHAVIAGEKLRFGTYAIDQLNSDIQLDLTQKTASHLTLQENQLKATHHLIQSLTLNSQGKLSNHHFNFDLKSDLFNAEGNGQGQWNTHQWQFMLNQAKIQPQSLPAWVLTKSVNGSLSMQAQKIDPHCWAWSNAQLCMNLKHTEKFLQGDVSLDQLPVEYFQTWLPTHAQPTGIFSGIGSFKQQAQQSPEINIMLNSSAGTLYQTPSTSDPITNHDSSQLSFSPSHISLKTNEHELSGDFKIDLNEQGFLQGKMTLPKFKMDWPHWKTTPLYGDSQWQLNQLAFLNQWLPTQLNILDGQWKSNFNFSGTLLTPQAVGQGVLSSGHVILDGPEVDLKNITGDVYNITQNGLDFLFSAQSGEGIANLSGQALFNNGSPNIIATLKGQNITAINTKEFQITASPNLTLNLKHHELTTEGSLEIPQAKLSPKSFNLNEGITPSTDQQLIFSNDLITTTSTKKIGQFNSDITLSLGNKVFFEGLGLKSRLSGNLHIIEKNNEKAVASGHIAIEEGRYRAYGQDLTIQTGKLLFTGGPLNQPGIDLQAYRIIDDATQVGIHARGALAKPEFSLFSQPTTMSQSEQLSYLVFGHPFEEGSQNETNLLFNLAFGLGFQQSNQFTRSLGKHTGIDDISIDVAPGQTNRQAALAIGKYLSPKLYLSYGIGLFDPISTVKVRYKLDQHWRFRTEASAKTTSGDLIYEIERGE